MIFRIPGRGQWDRSDEELLAEFRKSGDLEILGELYSRYMHLVYGVSLKYLKDRESSMDAVMQIFEKLITGIPRYNIENFRSWLHVVTRNHCLMQLRSAKLHGEKMAEWAIESSVFMENEPELHPIDEDVQGMDMALADCIERLKEEQKSCIRLFYFENRCYNEIADSLNMDEKKVKSHLQNGKRNLKICLEEKNGKKEER
ncbi:MAG: sigma-70 family RNA polymerase sigma factor [Bacteroidales bacterium]|jgi:RNA polymerase sigma-70 factor (ECF subfamily)